MAVIYSYPVKTDPHSSDLILISDYEDDNKTKQVTIADIRSATVGGVSSIIAGTPNVTLDPTAGTGNVTISVTESGSSEAIVETVRNNSGATIEKGQPLHITGVQGTTPTVEVADASNSAKMPVSGLANEQILNNANGEMIVSGILEGINTNGLDGSPDEAAVVYVSTSTGGSIDYLVAAGDPTDIPATEANLIQNVGIIVKDSPGTSGSIQVTAIGRTNATPNLNQGSIFIGDINGRSSSLAIGSNTHVLTSNGTTASWQAIPASGGVTSFTNAFGTYINGTTNTSATGAVTIGTIDLNAVDGTAIAGTRFLSKDNTWDVPAYNTYTASGGVLLTGTNFTNSDRGSSQNIFKTVAVSGQADIVADSNADTLTFAAGAGVTLTTNNLTDTLTIAASSSSGALSLLKTSVFGYTGTNQASYSEFALTNSTTFAPVRFHPTNPLSTPTNDVVVAITVPSTPANYIRVKTQFAVRSSTISQEFVHCAWHHASGSVTNPTYGWQTIGLDDDTTNDITVINYTTDLLVSSLLNLDGGEPLAGSTVYLWLKANCSVTGTDVLLGRWWPSTISSTSTSSVGPLIVEVYELVAGNRTFNPPTPE